MFSTPIVLIIFKREDTTRQVFEVLRQIKPQKLLLVADAPRIERADEVEQVRKTRAVFDEIDWECEVLRDYAEVNLGLTERISSGIRWAFEHVEEAIILEDDDVPDISFFRFCQEMLEKYRDDERVMLITGQCFTPSHQFPPHEYSYYFSRHVLIWGIATWRRAWKYYDVEIKHWPQLKNLQALRHFFPEDKEYSYWEKIMDNMYDNGYQGRVKTWDYQLMLAIWSQHGLVVTPNKNLVKNVGFGTVESTNAFSFSLDDPIIPYVSKSEAMDFPLRHPPFVLRDVQADTITQKVAYSWSLSYRIKRKIRSWLKKYSS